MVITFNAVDGNLQMIYYLKSLVSAIDFNTGWPQTWKTWRTWKTQGIRKIVKISGKTQGNLNFCREGLENSRKMKNR